MLTVHRKMTTCKLVGSSRQPRRLGEWYSPMPAISGLLMLLVS